MFDAAHHPIKLGMRRSAQNQPVGEVALNTPPVAELREALREMPFGDETVAMVERAYVHGRTMGAAFSALLKELAGGVRPDSYRPHGAGRACAGRAHRRAPP